MITQTKNIQKISPCLWFDDNAPEAVEYYMSVFENSKILNVSDSGNDTPFDDTLNTIDFELEGQQFTIIYGGPAFMFTPALSFVIHCSTQQEIDTLWEKLSEGGEIQDCGWVKDRFGVSWQIVPAFFQKMMEDKDIAGRNRVMNAMYKMSKPDIRTLQRAYAG
jgi:predicted 3-demethylubiquinone-9 3-methyltransferase (glyoxalase superfamily)